MNCSMLYGFPKILPIKLKRLIKKENQEKGNGEKGRYCFMKKRFLALALTVVLGISSLTGCGGKEEPADSGAKSEAGTETKETPAQTEGTGSGEMVTLNFPNIWVGTDSKAEVFGKMIAGFNEQYKGQYEVKVEEQTDYDAYRDKIRTLISTGAAPDIFTVDSMADLTLFAESGKIMDTTSYVEGNLADRFVESAIDNAKIGGVCYGVPYEMAVVPFMYNQKLMDAAGITELPASFEDFFADCEKLKESGVFPVTQMTNDNAWTSMLWYSYALAACGGADVYEKGLDDEAFVKAAEILKKMFDYTSSDAVGADASVVNGHFFNERAAIYTNGSWILGRIKTEGAEGLYDNLSISPGLSIDGKNGGAYVNSVLAYIVLGKQEDPNKQAAAEAFLEYITDPDRVLELSNSSGAMFAISYDATKITDPLQSEIMEQSKAAPFMIPYFNAAMPTAVANAFPSALESLVLGDVDEQGFVDLLKSAQ